MSYYTTIGPLGTDVSSEELTFGTLEKVVDTEVTGAAVTTITVTGLDLDSAKAYLILFKTKNPTATDGHIQLFINNDTTATNYYTQDLTAYGASLAVVRSNAPYLYTSHAGQSIIGYSVMMRPPDGQPRVTSFTGKRGGASLELTLRIIHYTIAGNVTRLDFTHTVAGGLDVGTRLIIFKVSR